MDVYWFFFIVGLVLTVAVIRKVYVWENEAQVGAEKDIFHTSIVKAHVDKKPVEMPVENAKDILSVDFDGKVIELKRYGRYEITYLDGDGARSSRKITLSAVNNKDHANRHISAYCFLAGEQRTFRVDRIGTVANAETGELLVSRFIPDVKLKNGHHALSSESDASTLNEAFEPYVGYLRAYGWDVEITDEEVGLYRRFENGKRRQTPDVSAVFIEDTPEDKRVLPWYVSSNVTGETGRSFRNLNATAAHFKDVAERAADELGIEVAC